MNLPPFLTEQWASAYFQILFSVLVFAIGIPFLGLQLVVQEDVRHVVKYRQWKIALWLLLVVMLFLSAVSFIWLLHPGPPGERESVLKRAADSLAENQAGGAPRPEGEQRLVGGLIDVLYTLDENYQAYIAGGLVTVIPIVTLAFGYWLPTNYTRRKVILQFRDDLVRGFNKRGDLDKETLEKIAYLGEHGNPGIEKKYVLDAYKYIAHHVQRQPVRLKRRRLHALHERVSARWPDARPAPAPAAEAGDAEAAAGGPAAPPKKMFEKAFRSFERLRERRLSKMVGYHGYELDTLVHSLIPILQYRDKPGNDENFKQAGELLKRVWSRVSGEHSFRDASIAANTLRQLGLFAIKENSEEVVLMYIKHGTACDDSVVFELGYGAIRAGLYKSATSALNQLESLALVEGGGALHAGSEATKHLLGLAAHFVKAGASGRRRAMRFLNDRRDAFKPTLERCVEAAAEFHYLNSHYETADNLELLR